MAAARALCGQIWWSMGTTLMSWGHGPPTSQGSRHHHRQARLPCRRRSRWRGLCTQSTGGPWRICTAWCKWAVPASRKAPSGFVTTQQCWWQIVGHNQRSTTRPTLCWERSICLFALWWTRVPTFSGAIWLSGSVICGHGWQGNGCRILFGMPCSLT